MKQFVLSIILVLLIFTSQSYAVKLATLQEVNRPLFIQIEGDDLFITDGGSNCLYVYSLKEYKLKHKIGKRGQGPGEFPHNPKLNAVTSDSIWCSSGDKILQFDRNGQLKWEKSFPRGTGLGMKPFNDNFVAVTVKTDWETRATLKYLNLLNPKFEKIKELYQVHADSNLITPNDTGNEEFRLLYHLFNSIIYKDKIFIADSKKGFFFDVYDSKGNHLYSITKKVKPVKVMEAQKKAMLDYLYRYYQQITRLKKKSAFTFYENYPPIRQFWIDSDKIYVTTYAEKEGKNEMIIMDLKGDILRTIYLPIKSTKEWKMLGEQDTHTTYKGILYELIESEETGDWELHKTDLSTVK